MSTTVENRIARELSATVQQVAAAVALLDGGATVPFIARYRKEATGGLDDTQLRNLQERLIYLRELDERRAAILREHRGAGQAHSLAARVDRIGRHQAAARGSVSALQAEAPHQGADCARGRARWAGGRSAGRSRAQSRNRGGEVPQAGVHHGARRQPWSARRQGGVGGRAADADGAVRRRCRIAGRLARSYAEQRGAGLGSGRRQGRGGREVSRLLRLPRRRSKRFLRIARLRCFAAARKRSCGFRSNCPRKSRPARPPGRSMPANRKSPHASISRTADRRPTPGCCRPRTGPGRSSCPGSWKPSCWPICANAPNRKPSAFSRTIFTICCWRRRPVRASRWDSIRGCAPASRSRSSTAPESCWKRPRSIRTCRAMTGTGRSGRSPCWRRSMRWT